MKNDTDWSRTYVGLRQHGLLSSFLKLFSQLWVYMELAGWLAGWHCWLLSGPEPAYLKNLMCFI